MRAPAVWLLALFVITLSIDLHAQEPRRVVLVVTAGTDAARAKSITDAIRAQLGDLPVAIVTIDPGAALSDLRERLDFAARACRENSAVGAFFVELERADDLLLYLVEPEAKRALVRRVKKTSGSEAASAEELSLIVRSTTSALLEGREIGMEEGPELAPRPPPPRPEPVAAPPPQKPKPAPPKPEPGPTPDRARLAVFYAGEAYAPEAPWQNGLGVALAGSPFSPLYFGIGYVAWQPVEAESDAARVRVSRYPVRAFAGYELHFDRFRVGGELGLLAEYTRRRTTETGLGVTPTPAKGRVGWAVSPRVQARYAVWERTSIGVGVGLDVFFNNSRYVADLESRRETLLSPYRARAEVNAGVEVVLW